MEPGQPETKRPRLLTGGPSWPSSGPLPPPPSSGPPPQHHQPPHQYLPPPSFVRPVDHHPNPNQHHHEDRRHHEQEQFPPMQDHHRQPPPSPAHHPPPPTYAQYNRDPIVKRDPGEEPPLPQMHRPNSTGNAPDGLPPPGHGPPQLGQHTEDPRRHMSYDNGTSMPQSPAVYRPHHPSFPPPSPSPMSHHPQYEQSAHAYTPTGPGSAEMYTAVSIASAKRKPQRASQACDSCRQLKAKCDEQKPCKNCKEKSIACVYRETVTKQSDKVGSDLLELMSAMKDQMTREFRKMDHRLSKLESGGRSFENQSTAMKMESVERDRSTSDLARSPSARAASEEGQDHSDQQDNDMGGGPSQAYKKAQETIAQSHEEELEEKPGPPIDPGRPSMPANHTTLAAYLLKWPSVHNLVSDILARENVQYPDEFPIRQEQQRGLLRVFGRGEGFDQESRPSNRDNQMDQAMTDYMEDNMSEVTSPAAAGEVWGQVGGYTPPTEINYKGGVLNPDGNPDFTESTVRKYVQSFKDNILNMHPILVPAELDALVTIFLESLPQQQQAKQSTRMNPPAKFVGQSNPASATAAMETGVKRKRSPGAEDPSYSVGFQKPGRPFRSIHSALVLLVIALGKICLHKSKLPNVVQEQETPSQSSPSIRNGVPASPLQGSPPGIPPQSHSSGLPSPKENERGLPSRRSSLQGAPPVLKGVHSMKRNIEVIPGLEYFALATDIIGSHLGGCNLKHVYVHIFAGLYHGQLGRVLESWSYINIASRTLHVILRPSLSRLSEIKAQGQVIDQRRDNLLAYAFWTCLQLESDILAELPLPQSGILPFEKLMPFPNMTMGANEGYPFHVIQSYQAQLYLRKQLNRIHAFFYSPEAPVMPDDEDEPCHTMDQMLSKIQDKLKDAKNMWLPSIYSFADNDPPAQDILSARLRAKYYGSQVIAYRPFLKMVLNSEPITPDMFSTPPPHPNDWARHGIHLRVADVPQNLDPRVVHYARLAIDALVESTRAFHGLDNQERFIITNVFGTAHAQWGNLMVLAACYRNNVLTRFIDHRTLSELYYRTIKFFESIAVPSSPLTIDLNILRGIAEKLGFSPREDLANSSFSSMTSAPPPFPPTQHSPERYSPGTPGRTMMPPSHSMA